MVVMGIDASTTSTGVAIFIEKELKFHTTLRPKGADWRDRLFLQGKDLVKIIEKYKPDIIYMEDVPLKSNGGLKTLVILGGVQGFVYGIAASYGIPINFILPTQWRSKLNMFDGTEKGKKRDVLKEKAVIKANELFNLNLIWCGASSKKSQDDEAESILIAYSQIKPRKFGK